jgi:hypothetical protein
MPNDPIIIGIAVLAIAVLGYTANDPIIIGIAVLAIAVLGYTAINGMMSGTKSKDKTDKGA